MEPLLPRIEAMLQGIVDEKILDATRDIQRRLFESGELRGDAISELSRVRVERDTLRAELESLRPKPAEPVEVDGFRVGDLVDGFHGPAPVEGLVLGRLQVQGSVLTPRYVARPPVKVGDTVRTKLIPRGKVVSINPVDGRAMIAEPQGSVGSCAFSGVLPIAPDAS